MTYTRALIEHQLTRPALRPNGGEYLQPGPVKAIIAHWTANENRGANAMANRNYFNNGAPGPGGKLRAASAHYCVDSERVVQCLPDHEIGFHVGDRPQGRYTDTGNRIRGKKPTPNYYTVGFEMCVNADGDFSQMRGRAISLAARLLFTHALQITDLYRHWDITGKPCPAFYVPVGAKKYENAAAWVGFCAHVNEELQTLQITHKRAMVTHDVDFLRLRAAPNVNAEPLGQLYPGERVCFNATAGNWAEVWPGHWANQKFLEVL